MVSRRRGQLLLVAAILMALAIVASVTLLNSIYAPASVGTGDVEGDAKHIERAHDELEAGLQEHFERFSSVERFGTPLPYVNSTNESVYRNDTERIAELYGDAVGQQSDGLVTVNYSSGTTGDALIQTDELEFTNTSGAGNWTMFDNIDRTVVLDMDVTSVSSTPTTLTADRIAGEDWRLNISTDGVRVEGSNVTNRDLCSLGGGDVTGVRMSLRQETGRPVVDVTSQSQPIACDQISLGAGVDRPYNLKVTNGLNTRGTYAITTVGDVVTANANSSAGGFPPVSRDDAVINPTFEVTYISSGITYESKYALYNRTDT